MIDWYIEEFYNLRLKGLDVNELLNLPSYMISGFLLTLAYEKFGLACATTAHVFNNLYGVVVTILMKFVSQYVGG